MKSVKTAHSHPMPPSSQSTIGSPTITMSEIAAMACEEVEVARAHEDAVEDERRSSEWLADRDPHEQEAGERDDGGVVGEDVRQHVVEREHEQRGGEADSRAPAQRAARREVRTGGETSAERLADERLRGDLERVEREREQRPDLHRDLLRSQLDLAEARRRRREDEEGAAQEQRAQEEQPAVAARRADGMTVGAHSGALHDGGTHDDHRIHRCRAELDDDRREG